MGLDVTAYSRLKSVGQHTDDYCEDEDHVHAFTYDDFPASFAGIPVLGTTKHGDTTFLEGGCYAVTDETTVHGFRAGSYSGYNHWRRWLSMQALGVMPEVVWNATEEYADKPFFELIHFADNEGCIGELAAAELLADFRQHAFTGDEWELAKYQDWTRACELAADGGLIRFH